MDKKELDFILQQGEGFRIEFKESLGRIDEDIVTLYDKTYLKEKVSEKFVEELVEGVGEKVGERVGEKVGERLTENQKKIIYFILKNPNISARELSKLVGISSRKIEENISKLKEKGLLKRVGPDKGGYWKVIEDKK